MFLVMDLDVWNSLSQGQQAEIETLWGQTISDVAAQYYDTASAEANERNSEAGIVKILLDEDQLRA